MARGIRFGVDLSCERLENLRHECFLCIAPGGLACPRSSWGDKDIQRSQMEASNMVEFSEVIEHLVE